MKTRFFIYTVILSSFCFALTHGLAAVTPSTKRVVEWPKLSVLSTPDAKQLEDLNLKNGKTTVLVFLSSSCPCSLSHEAHIKELSQQFADVNFVGIHASAGEDPQKVRKHFTSGTLPFTVLRDEKAKIATDLDATNTPQVFVFSPTAELIYSGAITDSHRPARAKSMYLQEVLSAISSGKDSPHAKTDPNGCTIDFGA